MLPFDMLIKERYTRFNEIVDWATEKLEKSYIKSFASWVAEEDKTIQSKVKIDNALFVLDNLMSISTKSSLIEGQINKSIDRLYDYLVPVTEGIKGLSHFKRDSPTIGTTAQFIYILEKLEKDVPISISNYVQHYISNAEAMKDTYTWHLSSVLASKTFS